MKLCAVLMGFARFLAVAGQGTSGRHRRSITAWVGLALSAVAVSQAGAAGRVEVSFIAPENYADIGRASHDRERTVQELGAYLESLGKGLADGQTLRVQVLDINLAGTLEPVRGGELRVVCGRADWPQVTLRYELRMDGKAMKSGEERVSDPSYLQTYNHAVERNGAYGFEKRMLRDWFRNTLLMP